MSVSVAIDRQRCTVVNKLTKQPEEISAIDRYFMEERNFIAYQAPPMSLLTKDKSTYQADLDEYEERLYLIEQDLKWLLSLPYQKFWCQVVYDSSCQNLIDSYLRLAPRPHDATKIKLLPPRIVELHDSIHHYIFLVCLRMSTYKETMETFLTPEGFAQLIYNHFLFDIPKILDICVLYKKNEIVSKMIENIFNLQKNYFDDFKRCVKDIVKAIDITKKKLRDVFDLDAMYKLDQSKSAQQKSVSLYQKIASNSREIFEYTYYLTDFVYTLNHLVDLQPKLADSLYEAKFEHLIKDLEEGTIFAIEDILDLMLKEAEHSESAQLLKQKFKKLKFDLAKLFYKMLRLCSIAPIVENIGQSQAHDDEDSNMQYYVDTFVKIICELIDDRRFLCYLEEKFQMSEQIQLIVEIADDKIDKSQYEYIIANIKDTILANSKKTSIKARFEPNAKRQTTAKANPDLVTTSKPSTSSAGACASADPEYLANETEKKMVQSVLDLFPDRDPAMVRKYLRYYKNDVEQLINALLENNLPPVVPDEPTKPSQVALDSRQLEALIEQIDDPDDIDIDRLKLEVEFDELSNRRNVYDGDNFDVFNRENVDFSKIHQGKMKKADAFSLDDKSDLKKLDYSKFAYVRDGSDDEYEDEYDDTYDERMGVVEKMEPGLMAIKPLNQKLAVKKRDQFDDDEEDEENASDDEEDDEQGLSAASRSQAVQSKNPSTSSGAGRYDRNNQQQQQQQQNRPNPSQQKQQYNKNTKFDYEQQGPYNRAQKGKNFYDNVHSGGSGGGGGQQNRGPANNPPRQQAQGADRNQPQGRRDQQQQSNNNNRQQPAAQNDRNRDQQQGGNNGQRRDQQQPNNNNRPQPAAQNERDRNNAGRDQQQHQANNRPQQAQAQNDQQGNRPPQQQGAPLPQRQPRQNQNQPKGPRPDNQQRNQNAQAPNRDPAQNVRPDDDYDGNPLNYRPPPQAAAAADKTEDEIKRERRYKNDNKSKVVHHNRRDLAAKKMNRGLGL